MAEVMADRRDFPRYALTLVAHLPELGNSAVLIARSSDVSRSSCYIDTLNPLQPGTEINIQLRAAKTSSRRWRVLYISARGLAWV
jgi:hypothetical protein